jgi:uncharacterized UPF0160 family protein
MKTVATHSGSFHADDVFAVAAFQLLLGPENVTVIRTRDDAVIAEADYAVDVGERYDHEAKRYDHHQPGSPVRENGLPYAGFGLMWKHYGESISGSKEVAEKIECSLCYPIDAGDNAIQVWEIGKFGIEPFEWDTIIKNFRSLSYDTEELDRSFMEAVDFARGYLGRKIAKEQKKVQDRKEAVEFYESQSETEILVSDTPISRTWFVPYEEVKVLVCPRDDSENADWMAIAVQVNEVGFETRVRFPEGWGGLRDEELQRVSGLPNAKFCHKDLYMCITRSKETAVEAARRAE